MNRKPAPLYEAPHRKRCPVCGERAYSQAGIHPQCSVQQADSERMKLQESKAETATEIKIPQEVGAWQRVCPKCQAIVHVRRKTCECGHQLNTPRPNAS